LEQVIEVEHNEQEQPLTNEEKLRVALHNIREMCPGDWGTIEVELIKMMIPRETDRQLDYAYIEKMTIQQVLEKLEIKVV
jgi:hypothetical protein